ncbi:MAG: hypothetical protein H0X26_01400 [Alphaproteobacteria bacterium]|nr:hypothetical protein [Alphaproteobacteria bacterium]
MLKKFKFLTVGALGLFLSFAFTTSGNTDCRSSCSYEFPEVKQQCEENIQDKTKNTMSQCFKDKLSEGCKDCVDQMKLNKMLDFYPN